MGIPWEAFKIQNIIKKILKKGVDVIMKGVYKFTNMVNGKSYIGQSQDLETRYKTHLRSFNKKNSTMYDSLFYRAIRKYGIENFKYEILVQSDSFSKQELNFYEIYYIDKFHTHGELGYNMNKGGNFTSSDKKLSEREVLQIKEELINSQQTLRDLSRKYEVSESLINMINSGKVWSSVGSTNFPLRKDKYIHQRGGNNARAKITDKDVLNIRKRYVSETLPEIHKDYDFLSFSEFKKIVYGQSFLHLPVYKKRNKQWILNGTCIDYPRLEE